MGIIGPSIDYSSSGKDLRSMFRHFGLGRDGKAGYELLCGDLCSYVARWKAPVVEGYKKQKGLTRAWKLVGDTIQPRSSRKAARDGDNPTSRRVPQTSPTTSSASMDRVRNSESDSDRVESDMNENVESPAQSSLQQTVSEPKAGANHVQDEVETSRHIEQNKHAAGDSVESAFPSPPSVVDSMSSDSVANVNERSSLIGSHRLSHTPTPGMHDPSSDEDGDDKLPLNSNLGFETENPAKTTNIPPVLDSSIDSAGMEQTNPNPLAVGFDGVANGFGVPNSPDRSGNAQLPSPNIADNLSTTTSRNRRPSTLSTQPELSSALSNAPMFDTPSHELSAPDHRALDSPPSDAATLSVVRYVPDADPLPRTAGSVDDSALSISTISLLQFTSYLLWARQRGRTTKFGIRWGRHFLETLENGNDSFRMSCDEMIIEGPRFIEIPPGNGNGRICIFGCQRDGQHEWIGSSVYVPHVSFSNLLI